MSEIKLVVCDLDGTLLNDEKMITPYTVSVMKKVREMGISVCLASGRDEQMMSIYDKQLGGCEYVLSDNGALVRSGERVIYCNFLAEEDTASLLAYLNEQKTAYDMRESDWSSDVCSSDLANSYAVPLRSLPGLTSFSTDWMHPAK